MIVWNDHCPFHVKVTDKDQLREVVDILLELGTCFAVIGNENTVQTTARGVTALNSAGISG